MQGFSDRLSEYVKMVEEALPLYLPDKATPYGVAADAMEYSLTGGGKRIRAALLLDLCGTLGGDVQAALPFACAVEMVHAYSLIHDDLPCMDDSPVRRSKPSCHVKYGEAVALLAGDGLLTLAFEVMLRHSDRSRLSDAQIIKASGALASAAGAGGMIGGQILDMLGEEKELKENEHELMNLKKTGELIRCSARIGCILANTQENLLGDIDSYAKNIGLAFQIIDDILDSIGNSAILGKPVGNDVKSGKQTYVSIYGESAARRKAESLIADAKAALACTKVESPFLYGLADMILSREK